MFYTNAYCRVSLGNVTGMCRDCRGMHDEETLTVSAFPLPVRERETPPDRKLANELRSPRVLCRGKMCNKYLFKEIVPK